MSNPSVNVLITGSDFLIKEGISALVQSLSDFQEVHPKYGSLYEKIVSADTAPQLLIHEFEKAGPGLYEQIEKIIQLTETKVLLIAGVIEQDSMQHLVQTGVKGIITKKCSKEEIVNAISTTVKGELFLCSKVLNVMLKKADSRPFDRKERNKLLSPREREVLTLITKGHTTLAIADILHLSVHTINSHRKNILKKLNLKSPAELIVFALENKLVDKD